MIHDGQVSSASTKKKAIAPPSKLEVMHVTAHSISLSWEAPKTSEHIKFYEIGFKASGSKKHEVVNTGRDTETFSLEDLQGSTKYTAISVRTVTEDGVKSRFSFAVEAKTEKAHKANHKGITKAEAPALPKLEAKKKESKDS